MICAALLAVVFLILRERRWAVGMLLLALLNVAPLSAWYLPGDLNKNPGSNRIKILHANVLGHDNDPAAMLAQIAAEQPDIVFLQEINDTWVQALLSIEGSYPYEVTVPRYDNFGIAVYARAPLLDIEVIDSPPDKLPTLKVRQDIDGRRVTYVSTHPFPPIGGAMSAGRNEQLASISELLVSIDGAKILVGDLNISMWAHHYKELEEATGMRNTRRGFGVIPTWPRHLLFAAIPIDHCLVSDEFAVLDTRAGPNIGSDHLPLVIELAL